MAGDSNQKINLGRKIMGWQVSEYEEHERGKWWYLITIGLALLLIGISVFTQNYLFVIIIIITAFIIVLHDGSETMVVPFSITDEGVLIGRKFIDYDDFKDFSIVYKPHQGVKNLYFEYKNFFKQRLSVPLGKEDPVNVRKILIKFLDEDTNRTDQPLSEGLAKIFKL